MTDNEKIIKVARFLRWKPNNDTLRLGVWTDPSGSQSNFPIFTTDDNAIDSAVRGLNDEQREIYNLKLWEVVTGEIASPTMDMYLDCRGMVKFVRATARQKTDAFVAMIEELEKMNL